MKELFYFYIFDVQTAAKSPAMPPGWRRKNKPGLKLKPDSNLANFHYVSL